jgi:hypothetical protein
MEDGGTRGSWRGWWGEGGSWEERLGLRVAGLGKGGEILVRHGGCRVTFYQRGEI